MGLKEIAFEFLIGVGICTWALFLSPTIPSFLYHPGE